MKRSPLLLLTAVLVAVFLLATIQVLIAATPAKLFAGEAVDTSVSSTMVSSTMVSRTMVSRTRAGNDANHTDTTHDHWRPYAIPDAPKAATTEPYPVVVQPDPIVEAWMASISVETVLDSVNVLSGEEPAILDGSPYSIVSRHSDSGEPLQKAVQYVGDRFARTGLAVEYHQWHETRPANVIGEITGLSEPEKIFIISAHLDNMPPGALAPGADDNASGSTAVLLAAETLSPYKWNCTLRFTLWTGEEQGLYGSRAYAQRARTANEEILGVLNFDMIGWNTPGSSRDIDIHARESVTNSIALAEQFADVIEVYQLDLIPEIVPNGTGASDHASFWSSGYPAILGIEDYHPNRHDFNPYYHTIQDRVEYLDMDYLTEFIRASIAGMTHMSGCLVTGTLSGTVTAVDSDKLIAGADVTATDNNGHNFRAVTNANGYYTITVPISTSPTDTFTVTASAVGFLPKSYDDVSVPGSRETVQDVALAREPSRAEIQTDKYLVGNAPVHHGESIDFVVTITNTGNVTLSRVPLTDTYDTEYLGYMNGLPPSDDESDDDGTIYWSNVTPMLAPGASVTVVTRFYAKADTSSLPLGVTENRATVSGIDEGDASLRSNVQLIAPTQVSTATVRVVIPLSADVTATNVQVEGPQVILTWSTFDERSLAGFHIVRQVDGDEPTKITEKTIEAQAGGAPIGFNYRFVDEVGNRTEAINYRLQVYYIDGTMREMNLGTIPRPESIFLPIIQDSMQRAAQ